MKKLLIITQKVDQNDDVLGFFHEWIREFASVVETVTVICLYEGKHMLPENVKVLSLGKESGVGKVGYIKNFFSYIIRERKNYDVVFVHMNPIYLILAGWYWRILGKRIALWYTHKHVDIKLRIAAFFSHIIFSASRESFRLKTKKVVITGHGIDTEHFKPVAKPEARVLNIITVGRISPIKDYETIIEAIELLVASRTAVTLKIVGKPAVHDDEEYFEKIKSLVKEKHLENNIVFTGGIPHREIVPLLQQADVFVNVSNTGSVDKAVLEAMACGVIPVTSNEAFKPILSDYPGLLFAKSDSRSLASAIEYVYSQNTSARFELRQAMRTIVTSHHELGRLIQKIISLLI